MFVLACQLYNSFLNSIFYDIIDVNSSARKCTLCLNKFIYPSYHLDREFMEITRRRAPNVNTVSPMLPL